MEKKDTDFLRQQLYSIDEAQRKLIRAYTEENAYEYDSIKKFIMKSQKNMQEKMK